MGKSIIFSLWSIWCLITVLYHSGIHGNSSYWWQGTFFLYFVIVIYFFRRKLMNNLNLLGLLCLSLDLFACWRKSTCRHQLIHYLFFLCLWDVWILMMCAKSFLFNIIRKCCVHCNKKKKGAQPSVK